MRAWFEKIGEVFAILAWGNARALRLESYLTRAEALEVAVLSE